MYVDIVSVFGGVPGDEANAAPVVELPHGSCDRPPGGRKLEGGREGGSWREGEGGGRNRE